MSTTVRLLINKKKYLFIRMCNERNKMDGKPVQHFTLNICTN